MYYETLPKQRLAGSMLWTTYLIILTLLASCFAKARRYSRHVTCKQPLRDDAAVTLSRKATNFTMSILPSLRFRRQTTETNGWEAYLVQLVYNPALDEQRFSEQLGFLLCILSATKSFSVQS